MSKSAVDQVIQRAVSDAAFRRQLRGDPQGALAGFDLTSDERAAVTTGDPTRLTALGVDQRMSKAFSIPDDGPASSVISGDTSSGAVHGITDEVSGGGHAALISDASAAQGVLVGDPGSLESADIDASAGGSHLSRIESDLASPDMSAVTAFDNAPVDNSMIDPGFVSDTSGGAVTDVGTSIDTGVDMSGDFRTTD